MSSFKYHQNTHTPSRQDILDLNIVSGEAKTYKLMIKTHWATGLSYLCITKRKNYHTYKGSGTTWNKFLDEHDDLFVTTLLFTTNDVDELNKIASLYSDYYDVVNSEDFLNKIPERGYRTSYFDIFKIAGSKGGRSTKNNKSGIFNEDLQHMRSDWAKLAASKVVNRGGYCKEGYINLEGCSNAGKIGGKITGAMPWWTDGVINTRSYTCPGNKWRRGMTKKKKSV